MAADYLASGRLVMAVDNTPKLARYLIRRRAPAPALRRLVGFLCDAAGAR